MLKTAHAAALTAVAAVLFATPAAAEPFETFIKACVANDGDARAAITTVSALGWKPAPASAIGDAAPNGLENAALHFNFDPDGDSRPESIEVLMTGRADGAIVLEAPGIVMDVCGLVAPRSDTETLTRQVTAYFGAPPQRSTGDYSAWIYSRQNGQIRLETALMDADEDALLAAVRQRPLFAVYTVDQGRAPGLMLGAFHPTKDATR